MKVGDIELAESNIFPEWDDVVKFVVSKAPLLLGAVIIVVVGFVLSNLVGKLVVKGMRARGIDPSIHTFIKTIVVLLLKFAVILSALSTMNVDVNSFIAAIGAAGITAGLGLQASVSQFASGIQILINHPFKSGDYIDLGTVSGKVHEIKMMYTELITVDNKRVIVPNSHITGSNIINYNSESKRRIDLVFGISYDADIAKAKEVIAQTVRKNELILTEPEPIIAVSAQAASSVNISCLVWCHTDDYWNVFIICRKRSSSHSTRIKSQFPMTSSTYTFQKI